MTRRTYANISDAELRNLRFLIAGWALVNFGRKGLGTACA